jgi:anti-repressor protein
MARPFLFETRRRENLIFSRGDFIMKELIPVHHTTIKNEIVMTADGRDVHRFIQSGHKFYDWIKDRISVGGYEKDRDFCRFSRQTPSGGRPSVEYMLTLDMAKELCMMERNQMGLLARRYFVRCEKEAKKAAADISVVRETLLNRTPEWKQIARYKAKGLGNKDTALLCGVSEWMVRKAIADMKACRVIPDVPAPALLNLPSQSVVKHMVKALPQPGQETCGTRLNRTAAKELLAARPQWVKMLRYRGMDLNYTEIGTLCRVSPTTVRDNIRRMADCGLVDLSRDLPLFPEPARTPEARA